MFSIPQMQLINQDRFGDWTSASKLHGEVLTYWPRWTKGFIKSKNKSITSNVQSDVRLWLITPSWVWWLCGVTSNCAEEQRDSGFSVAATTGFFCFCLFLGFFAMWITYDSLIYISVPYGQKPLKISAISELLCSFSAKLNIRHQTHLGWSTVLV